MHGNKRITRDELGMRTAGLIASRGTCQRAQVGCAIFREGRQIVSGYNGPLGEKPHCKCDLEKPCERAIHAEANAIYFAAKKGISLENTKLYCTHQPCLKCTEAIIQAGIKSVVYKERYRDEAGLNLLLNNSILVYRVDFEAIYQIGRSGQAHIVSDTNHSYNIIPRVTSA